MLSPREEYGLPSPKALRWLKQRLRGGDALLEDLFLALADFPVDEITPEDKELLRANMRYWKRGYAMPMTVVRELGGRRPLKIERDFPLILRGVDIAVEPDVNYDYAREFVERVNADEVLDIGSGFGWIPALLSRKARVYALDKAYLNRIIYGDDRITIEGTNIELFPGSPTARRRMRREKDEYRHYRDFARLFWSSRGAKMDNITQLQGDATDMRRCRDLMRDMDYSVASGSLEAVTCFFSLNHISPWQGVLKEVHRVLANGGEALITLYKEHLEKFPVKFVYDWVEQLGAEIIKYGELEGFSRALGFKVSLVPTHKGDEFFYLLQLKK
jgi:ubiquinone/menaquinone biosynthesis C-methylase UbiE